MIVYELILGGLDEDYIKMLGQYIREHYSEHFNVKLCCDKVSLRQQLESRESRIFVVEEKLYDEEARWLKDYSLAFKLTDIQQGEKSKVLFKYQKGSQIVRGILSSLAEIHGEHYFALQTGKRNMTAIYSPVGGCGKTTLARQLATTMAVHEKVLYINMEYYPGVGCFYNPDNKYNLSDLLFYGMKEQVDLKLKAEAMVNHEANSGVDYMNPHNTYQDILHTKPHVWLKIFRVLSEMYDQIILDFDTHYEGQDHLINMCHYHILVAGEGGWQREKFLRWYGHAVTKSFPRKRNLLFVSTYKQSQGHTEEPPQFTGFTKEVPDLRVPLDSSLKDNKMGKYMNAVYQYIVTGKKEMQQEIVVKGGNGDESRSGDLAS